MADFISVSQQQQVLTRAQEDARISLQQVAAANAARSSAQRSTTAAAGRAPLVAAPLPPPPAPMARAPRAAADPWAQAFFGGLSSGGRGAGAASGSTTSASEVLLRDETFSGQAQRAAEEEANGGILDKLAKFIPQSLTIGLPGGGQGPLTVTQQPQGTGPDTTMLVVLGALVLVGVVVALRAS